MFKTYVINLDLGLDDVSLCAGETLVFDTGLDIKIKNVEEESYSITDLISDIGGTIGLFLGLSIVQLAFIVKGLCVRMVYQIRRWFGASYQRFDKLPILKF